MDQKGAPMIGRRTPGWWGRLSSVGVLVALVSCAGRPGSDGDVSEIDEPGSLSGKLAIYIADYADGASETRYFLRMPSGEERRLVFQEHPTVDPGAKVRVWGAETADALAVSRFQVISGSTDGIGSQSSALIKPPPQAPRIFCSVLVTINNGAVPSTLGIAQTETQFHVGPTSVNAYYVENSYGRNSIGGKTYGPFNFNMSGCSTDRLSDTIRPMVPDPCDQYGFVMVPEVSGCGWAGLGEVGTATEPATDTWYNGTLGCVATVQEPGHNFGMNHSSSINCGTGVPFADDLSSCRHSEYGDRFDTMGSGCRHMNVWQKQYQGWFGGCNAVKVNASGTFYLLPIEQACDGIQSLQIPFPNGKTRPFPQGKTDNTSTTMTTYYLEYRTSLGFDKPVTTPQVLLHAAPNPVTGGSKAAPHTWIINTSGTSTNPGLIAGRSFKDPAGGLTITVTALDAQKATIQVDYPGGTGAASTCVDGTALTPPGPTTCAGAVGLDGGVILPGDSGVIGSGGSGGTSGSRDGGRDTGSGGSSGSVFDATGSGTSTGAGGSVGGSTIGSGTSGSAGAAGSGRNQAKASDLEGGCDCRIAAGASSGGKDRRALLLALALLGSVISRRRRA